MQANKRTLSVVGGMKFFGTNSGAFGDKIQDVVFPQTAGSSGITDNVPLLVFGVNGCASGEKQ